MKPSGIGGMAVMEGVMMKNKDIYAVAVRKPDNEIAVDVNTHHDFSDKVKLFKLPIFRGMLAFVDSLVVGIKVLNYSASFFEEEEETLTNKKKNRNDSVAATTEKADLNIASDMEKEAVTKEIKKDDKTNALLMAFAVLISIVMSVALFMVLPVLITNLFSRVITNQIIINLIEGVLRLAIFIGYVILASRMNEIKRVFMYHGAEHKTINCLENGYELTVENVRRQSKQHKRCGTSFMLLVILISLIFFLFLPSLNLLGRVLSRVLLVPFIAGVSYEFIRLAGKSENKVVTILSQPGLWMQGLTTKEPDDSMIEVAIKSVEAVFDWRAFLKNSGNKRNSEAKKATGKQTQSGNKTIASTKTQPGKQNAATNQKTEKQTSVNDQDSKKTGPAEKKIDGKPENSSEAKEKDGRPSQKGIKTQMGGIPYTGKVPAADQTEVQDTKKADLKQPEGVMIGRNKGGTSVTLRPDLSIHSEDEDDDILKALDKFFDDGQKEKD